MRGSVEFKSVVHEGPADLCTKHGWIASGCDMPMTFKPAGAWSLKGDCGNGVAPIEDWLQDTGGSASLTSTLTGWTMGDQSLISTGCMIPFHSPVPWCLCADVLKVPAPAGTTTNDVVATWVLQADTNPSAATAEAGVAVTFYSAFGDDIVFAGFTGGPILTSSAFPKVL